VNIPNLPALSPVVDDNKMRTPTEQVFMDQLIQELRNNAGPEGLVPPTQSPSNITIIQNNQNEQGYYTCQLGTILYSQHPSDYTQDKVVIAVRNDNTYPTTPPLFKTVTLT